MKKILLIAVFAFSAVVALAQSDRKVDKIVVYTSPFIPEHEFRIGVEVLPTTKGTHDECRFYNYRHSYMGGGNDYYGVDGKFNVVSLNVSYTYRFERWLEVGVGLTYNGSYNDVYLYRNQNSYLVGNQNITDVSVIPMVRFSWYRSKYVRLYSLIGAGITFSSYTYQNDKIVDRDFNYGFAGQLTPFGISVGGSKLFGYAELAGVGSMGVASFGIGYRFVDKKASVDKNIKY